MKYQPTMYGVVHRCKTGKIVFSKKEGQTKKNQLEREGRERLRLYHCPMCNYWHLTKK